MCKKNNKFSTNSYKVVIYKVLDAYHLPTNPLPTPTTVGVGRGLVGLWKGIGTRLGVRVFLIFSVFCVPLQVEREVEMAGNVLKVKMLNEKAAHEADTD